MRRVRRGLGALLALVGAGVVGWLLLPAPPPEPQWALENLLGQGPEDAPFRQVRSGQRLQFPRDHRAHPDYRHEWWYLTGQLGEGEAEPQFGFQLTLFRFALAPPTGLPRNNPWIGPQVYMGHLAVSDLADKAHRAVERITRSGPGLAGTSGNPLQVWLGDWQLRAQREDTLFPLRLEARDRQAGVGLALTLNSLKPRVLQGDGGISVKNREGGASFYYSYTRLEATGTVHWDGRSIPVRGSAWYDHEWSSNSLAPHQAGWDWFSLQLDDGRELMAYRFRNRDGSPGWQQLALVDPEGRVERLEPAELTLEALDHWRSPRGARYPAKWRLQVPARALDLVITPRLADQEMDLSVRYWEGAVTVTGSHRGQGYVELTGY